MKYLQQKVTFFIYSSLTVLVLGDLREVCTVCFTLNRCVREVCLFEWAHYSLFDSQAEEEAAKLASMPAWRRDIMKKKLEEEKWVRHWLPAVSHLCPLPLPGLRPSAFPWWLLSSRRLLLSLCLWRYMTLHMCCKCVTYVLDMCVICVVYVLSSALFP